MIGLLDPAGAAGNDRRSPLESFLEAMNADLAIARRLTQRAAAGPLSSEEIEERIAALIRLRTRVFPGTRQALPSATIAAHLRIGLSRLNELLNSPTARQVRRRMTPESENQP